MPRKINIKPDQAYFPVRPSLKPYYRNKYDVLWETYFGYDHQDDRRKLLRWYLRRDLFFLLYYGFNRKDVNDYDKPFVVLACQEVEDGPDTDTIDLWSRRHYKSTIARGHLLQDLLNDKEKTACVFSHNRPLAKSHLMPIKNALERNDFLRFAFPDIIWRNPRKEAPTWSLDTGLELNREAVSNTHSLEASGLIEGLPAGKHFDIRDYDDVITEKVVSPDMMAKAEYQFRLSFNLKSEKYGWQRIQGTNYHYGDFYQTVSEEADNGIYPWHVRRKPWWTEEPMGPSLTVGLPPQYIELFGHKNPILLSPERILQEFITQTEYIFACQFELNPSKGEHSEFKIGWLKYYRQLPANRLKYILVDPANEKKPESDYTAIALVSIDDQRNRFLENLIRAKLDLGERWAAIDKMVQDHKPIVAVYYEKYGKDSDIWYIQQKQLELGRYFTILPIGGRVKKPDRIRRLQPVCREGRFYLPEQGIWEYDRDLVREFIDEEYDRFPFCKTFDMFDAISRIEDPEVEAVGPMNTMGDLNAMQDRYTEEHHVEGL